MYAICSVTKFPDGTQEIGDRQGNEERDREISKFTVHWSCVNLSAGHMACEILIQETEIIYEQSILMEWTTLLLENLPNTKEKATLEGRGWWERD